MNLSFKKRRPIVYISLGIYLLLTLVIVAEACIPGGLSGKQSNIFAQISAWFVNLVEGPQIPKTIEPSNIIEEKVTDSSYLGKGEDQVSNIAIGTTTLVTLPIQYPKKENSYDVYDYAYTLNPILGNEEHYKTVISSSEGKNNTYTINLRIVANEMGDDLYQIDVKVAESLVYHYKFHIVELAAPTNYEAKIEKNELKIGESLTIETKLLDGNKNDAYLKRYLDESKISRSSSNEEIATVDQYGVIHAINEGSAIISYGYYQFEINVSNETIVKPIDNELVLDIEPTSNANPCLLDYDYVFNDGENSNEYSTLVYANFVNEELEDTSVSWSISDNLKGKLAPYKYDEDGYPIYHDDEGKECVRVCGYRKRGEVTLTCVSNVDNSLTKSIVLNTQEAVPTSMKINTKDAQEIYVNQPLVISATFGPKNVSNTSITVTPDKENLVNITNNNSSSVTISGAAVGNVTLTISSVGNPELNHTITINFIAKQAINNENFNSFSSFMRKFAGHFTLFLVTAIFGMIFFYSYLYDKRRLWLAPMITLGCGVFTAGFSEFLQLYVKGRSGAILDVGIDSLGFLIGMAVTFGICLLVTFLYNKKKKTN